MQIRIIEFSGEHQKPHLELECLPPFPDLNLLFRVASHAILDPYRLAIELGKVTEETATRLYARLYAEAVIRASPTPGFEDMTRERWAEWLIEHPVHFTNLRSFCDFRNNWVPVKDAAESDTLEPDQGGDDGGRSAGDTGAQA